MKNHIKQEGMWWRWIEICDRCGSVIRNHNTRSTNEPNKEEVDFCVNCLKYFLDNNISYENYSKGVIIMIGNPYTYAIKHHLDMYYRDHDNTYPEIILIHPGIWEDVIREVEYMGRLSLGYFCHQRQHH